MQETINGQEEYILKQNVKIYGCMACPYFVNKLNTEDEDEEDEEYQEGYCDLARKNISMRILTRPRWCPLKRKKNNEED